MAGGHKSSLFYYLECDRYKHDWSKQMTKTSKFNVNSDLRQRTYNVIIFDSRLEMTYYRDVLCPLEKSGDIVYCELQKPYELQPKFIHDNKTVQPIKYVADFFCSL